MKKIFLTIAIFITVNNFAFSQEEIPITTSATVKKKVKKDNMKTVIHFHPMTLFMSIPASVLEESPMGWFYSTIEKPLDLSNSLIIKPSLWLNVSPISFYGKNDEFSRFGSDIGLRHYSNKNGEGFYLQAQCGVFFIENRNNSNSFVGIDIMGYLGFSKKFKTQTVFFDIGLGIGNSNVMVQGNDFEGILDINFGLGFKF